MKHNYKYPSLEESFIRQHFIFSDLPSSENHPSRGNFQEFDPFVSNRNFIQISKEPFVWT